MVKDINMRIIAFDLSVSWTQLADVPRPGVILQQRKADC